MSDLPYMPLWVSKYEAHTAHLTLCEDGAYLRLLRLCWRTPGGTIPADDAWVARQMRVDADMFASTVKPILTEFFTVRRGRYVNDALKRFFDEANEKNTRRKNAGRKGGEAKARKSKETTPSNATPMPEHCSSKTETETHTETDDANASSVTPTRSRRRQADLLGEPKPHFIEADWKPSPELMRWAVDEFRTPHGESLTEEEVRNEADSFVDYWTGRRDAKAKRPGWDATFRARIREQAAKILRARPRAANGARNGSGYGKPQSQFAPAISQHDAFALAAAQASGLERDGGWEPDHGHDPRPQVRPPRLEIIDSGDARGAGAGSPGGDRGNGRQTVLPLPLAASR